MSIWENQQLSCPSWACSGEFSANVAKSLHITRQRAVRTLIVERTFHRIQCPSCGETIRIDRPLLYTDFERHHWVHVALASELGEWRRLQDECLTLFRRSMTDAAPTMIRTLAPDFRVRVVFGYEELREKLLIWDAGLDEAYVECLKLQTLRADPAILSSRSRLVCTEITEDGTIQLHRAVAGVTAASPVARVMPPTLRSLRGDFPSSVSLDS